MNTDQFQFPKGVKYITQEMAAFRKSRVIGPVEYELILRMEKGERYKGVVNVVFSLLDVDNDIFIDYNGDTISQITVNTTHTLAGEQDNFAAIWDKKFVQLPKQCLLRGINTLTIKFSNKYSSDGAGLHSFVDEDKKQYIYSNCEPNAQYRIFPCFDQPDIKGFFKFRGVASNDWTVISNDKMVFNEKFKDANQLFSNTTTAFAKINQVQFAENLNDTYNVWDFAKTKPISTYLYAMIAGPYTVVHSTNPYKGIPMAIYCRESLHKYLVNNTADKVFNTTDKVMEFYEQFFGFEYPFSKYDHIFCPEFNHGAMENAGAITVNDGYIFKDDVKLQSISYLAIVVAHELAHMWFGDLVTMKWWNDLWLNESFADFVAYYALSKVKLNFEINNMGEQSQSAKGWGYRDDQLSTSHPIAGDVKDTEEAENVFDGITYSKGHAVMHQLLCLIGEKTFSTAMKQYFHKFQYNNSTLNDFIDCMDEQFKKLNPDFDLKQWKDEWLCKAGLNECEPQFDSSKTSQNEQLIINQSAALPQFNELRRHKMKVGFFDAEGKVTVYDVVLQKQQQTVVKYDGSKHFKAVLLNFEDESFIKVILDKQSIEFYKNNLYKVQDGLSRQIIWRSFFDMVRDGKASALDLVKLFQVNIKQETSEGILTQAMTYLSGSITYYTPKKYKKQIKSILYEVIKDMLIKLDKTQPSFKNKEITLRDNLITFAEDEAYIDELYRWYKGVNDDFKNVSPLTIYNQWKIIQLVHKSSKYTLEEKKQALEKQSQLDQSDQNKKNNKICQAIIATAEKRKELWASYLDPNPTESNMLLFASMSGFNNDDVDLKEYYELYFKELENVFQNRLNSYAQQFANYMFPDTDDLKYLFTHIGALQAKLKDSQLVSLVKFLSEQNDSLIRKENAYKIFEQNVNFDSIIQKL